MLHVAEVKVMEVGLTVPSAVLLDDKPMVTSAVGWLLRTMVKVACPPDSDVVSPEVGATVIPASSLSVLVAETVKLLPV